ncbi:hypothetical protein LEP1GSC016_3176 [Leptospira borgpetersenii serovar Hardjo-bovis str. Sponselee]|uniref:Uncharacterized protein n=1 Tax=Leptospira borgpetersenii serovar Hardjo-bovis str. Sponselee TaxID=1303729 RepID=M6C5H5_LEPBO|nr:hypothetical protein LEP1GSC016_3176 [Leptospira borgpetersenii serovar Hardjo-bovis str. Sponselee]
MPLLQKTVLGQVLKKFSSKKVHKRDINPISRYQLKSPKHDSVF